MPIEPRKITCDTKGCNNSYSEKGYGDGLPGWGIIKGASDEKGNEPCLCPDCMVLHLKILNGEIE
jgi:hypothetical protein